jgi:hypothetical protein
VVAGSEVVAHSLSDGHELFATSGVCCMGRVSPDGKHLYVRTTLEEMGELTDDGHVAWHRPSEMSIVASNEYVAVQASAQHGGRIEVYRHGAERPIRVVERSAPSEYLGSLTLSGSDLVYFDAGERALVRVEVVTGKRTRLYDLKGSTMSTPAVVQRPLVLIPSWSLIAVDLR